MSISTEHLAELLSGIARAQQAIVDAVERSNGGWRNTHLIPMLNVAANMRAPEPRLLDLPSRILLRFQGRAAVDNASIVADLERLFALPPGGGPAADMLAPPPPAPAIARAAARANPAAPAAAAPPAPAAAPPAATPAAASGPDMDFSKPS